jgi:arylsulfatase
MAPNAANVQKFQWGTSFLWNHLPSNLVWELAKALGREFPPLQAPESYNLSQVMELVKSANHLSD